MSFYTDEEGVLRCVNCGEVVDGPHVCPPPPEYPVPTDDAD
jgi:hypothetical protein